MSSNNELLEALTILEQEKNIPIRKGRGLIG